MPFTKEYLRVELFFEDADVGTATHGVYLPVSAVAQAEAWALEYVNRVRAIIGVKQAKLVVAHQAHDLLATQAASADLSQCGVFIWRTLDADQRAVFALPGIRSDLLETTGDWAGIRINELHADVVPFLTQMLDGAATVRPCSPDRDIVTALSTAYVQVRDPGRPLWEEDRAA